MFQTYKHVHFVGIGGIGMSALAKWMIHEGIKVSGSDLHLSQITDNLEIRGAKIYSGHAITNIANDVDLLVYTSAISEDNIERVCAHDLGITQKTNFEVLGEISKSFSTIVVTGTNGKSTTTAMLGRILIEAGYDPSVLVGSLVPGFQDGNLRIGNGHFFVIEGCEYKENMMNLEPEMIVLTNIEEDHLDYYRDLKHIQDTFQRFVNKLKGKGLVIYNAIDNGIKPITFSRGVSFGTGEICDYCFHDRQTQQGKQKFGVYRKEDEDVYLGQVELNIPGEFNIYNSLAAISAAMELGIPFETCARSLKTFNGIWRRFERVGVWKSADLVSDYGHHPSAIRQTVNAAREFFPGRRIVLCYQPHQHDRTKKLFSEFVKAISLADNVVLCEIYDVAGRNEEHDVSSKDLVHAIHKNEPGKDVIYAQNLNEAESNLRDLVQSDDVILIMGAGDIDELARKLV